MIRTLLLEPLFNALLALYALIPGGDFGVAVIVLTVIIRLALWPLVKKQLYHQKAMRDLQPEIKKLKERAKGDKQKESQMMMELFKEKEVNPFASLGIALLQFPILIALFFVLRDIFVPGEIEAFAYSFVQTLPLVSEVIANPELFDPSLLGWVDMAEPSIYLALLAGLAQYAQAKQLMPKDTSKTQGGGIQGMMSSNMMLIFPVVTVAIAAQFPAALALYWAVSSMLAVVQQEIVLREDVAFMQKLATLGRRGKRGAESK